MSQISQKLLKQFGGCQSQQSSHEIGLTHCACGRLLDEGFCERCRIDWQEAPPKAPFVRSSKAMIIPPFIVPHEHERVEADFNLICLN